MKRKHRLSLAVGIAAFVIGAVLSASHYLASSLPAAINGFIAKAGEYIGIGSGTFAIVPFGAFLALEGFLILIFRKKKRFSMFLSVPFIALIYFTALSYTHIRSGNPHPAFILSRVNTEKTSLLLLCVLLEALLYIILMLVAGKADARLVRRAEKKAKREELADERRRAEAEEAEEESDDEEDDSSESGLSSIHEKEDKEYLRMKKKMERKQRKEEERFARKEEKKRRKEEAKEEKARLKEEKKAGKTESESSETISAVEDENENSFLTRGAEPVRRYIDPNAPVDVPEVGELPRMKRLKSVESAPSKPSLKIRRKASMPPVSDVFPEIKKELEREAEDEKKAEESEETHYDPKRTESFQKGGMIEATLETMINMANENAAASDSARKTPIKGFEKKEPKERKNDSSFAPSNLSPDHPRYKMFESLTHQKGVSSFPAKSFEAEVPETEKEPLYGSTFVKEEPVEKKIPGLSGFMKSDEVMPEPPKMKIAPAVSADDDNDPFEELQKEEALKKAKRQAEHKEEKAEEAAATAEESAPLQDTEFLYAVGIGGLVSNELGYASIARRQKVHYSAPPKNILKEYPQASNDIDEFTKEQGDIIVETLADYHVSVTMDSIIKGPTVTMYELKLGEGVMVQRIKSRYDELSYSLGGVHIRILAPVPGRQAVGIEVPNKKRAIIGFKDMLNAMERNPESQKLRVPMILGRTITGEPVSIDVAKMPHMLIAGTTGSGKSVCINSLICTLIYTRTPQEVRLIMVDPKVVELTVYNGIPHLLTPVITEDKKVVRMLKWLVDEMERRYQMLFRFGVRNIEGLNAKIRNENIPAEKLPYIVLIMDEFADLMTTVGKDIENYIARLAAKARAAGIHLILATQRPSADVITGTIKNNFPARIAFAVSSGTNSRIILDENGAEDLLGKGDMLLMEPSTIGLQRIQGAFLSDDEVYDIVSYAQKHGTPDYLADDIFEEPETNDDGEGIEVDVSDEDSDEVLYETAKQIVYERKNASASYLQRRMKIGYNRAARIIEMMEERGIIGPPNGSKPREILKYE